MFPPHLMDPWWPMSWYGVSLLSLMKPSIPPSPRLQFAACGLSWHGRLAAVTFVLAVFALLTNPGVEAQTTLTVNGASGSNTVSTAQSTTGGLVINQIFGVEYLLVGGGGASGAIFGANASGAGGAGGLLHNTGTGAPLALSGNAYAVTVGAGGQGTPGNSSPSASPFAAGSNGADSVFGGPGISTLTAFGGGGGGVGRANSGAENNGRNGGSGGAAGGRAGTSGGLGTSGQGNTGGGQNGKGGGAGQSGAAGGQGLQVNITGTSTYYAGGGGDSAQSVLGGGGRGSGSANTAPQNGSPNTGGGGGSAWSDNGAGMSGASGGSGIVVLRYGGLVLPGLTTSVTSGSGAVTRTSYTADGTNGVNGQLYQVYSFTIGSSTTSGSFAFDMSAVNLNARLGTTLTGVISGTGGLTFNGPGRLTLDALNTYSGSTTVAAGTLALVQAGAVGGSSGISILGGASLDVSGIGGGFSLGTGQSLGGAGSILGNLTFGSGSQLVFSQTATLTLSGGTASFFSGTPGSRFGIDDLIGLTSSTPESTYTLLSGAVDTTNLDNVGASNAFNLGGGKSAYFQSGSLQVVVVPEPGSVALALLGLGGAAWALRRRAAR